MFSRTRKERKIDDAGIGGPDYFGGGQDDRAVRCDRGLCAESWKEGVQYFHAE